MIVLAYSIYVIPFLYSIDIYILCIMKAFHKAQLPQCKIIFTENVCTLRCILSFIHKFKVILVVCDSIQTIRRVRSLPTTRTIIAFAAVKIGGKSPEKRRENGGRDETTTRPTYRNWKSVRKIKSTKRIKRGPKVISIKIDYAGFDVNLISLKDSMCFTYVVSCVYFQNGNAHFR